MNVVTETRPRRSPLTRAQAHQHAATEYARFADALDQLEPDDWTRPTACERWDVRALAGHTLGMAQFATGLRALAGQMRAAGKRGQGIDALTDHQVDRNAGLDTDELRRRMREVGPRAAAGRRRLSGWLGSVPLPEKQHANGQDETWKMAFLFDVILTRDPWMHRSDLAEATRHPMRLTADHDGAIVAGVVSEWASRHDAAYDLTLTGEAGGRWTRGSDRERIELDAVEFCRILSGRGGGTGLLAVQVPF